MRRAVLCAAVTLTGCTIGAGSSFIGAWRDHDVPRLDACLVDATGACRERKLVSSHVAERGYSGMVFNLMSLGAGIATYDGETTTHFRVDASVEYLRGRGAFAAGLRTGFLIETHGAAAAPVTGMIHYALGDRVALTGGLGYAAGTLHGETAPLGAQSLAGVDIALGRTRTWNYTALSIEVDSTWLAFSHLYRTTGITGSLAFFF